MYQIFRKESTASVTVRWQAECESLPCNLSVSFLDSRHCWLEKVYKRPYLGPPTSFQGLESRTSRNLCVRTCTIDYSSSCAPLHLVDAYRYTTERYHSTASRRNDTACDKCWTPRLWLRAGLFTSRAEMVRLTMSMVNHDQIAVLSADTAVWSVHTLSCRIVCVEISQISMVLFLTREVSNKPSDHSNSFIGKFENRLIKFEKCSNRLKMRNNG